jgi:hypothetical protein
MQTITMAKKQLHRYEVLTELRGGVINGTAAAEKLSLSVRHVRRLKKKAADGAEALSHGNKGKVSPRRTSSETEEMIAKLLKGDYRGFGPTFASEKLLERNEISTSSEWLRQFMIRESLWKAKARKDKTIHRVWRHRMKLEGVMEQYDGSYHKWISSSDEELCLLASIDDATGKIIKAHFDYHEGITPTFTFWKNYAESGKLPQKVYVDKFSTYKVNHKNAVDEPEMITQFERALKTLGVELIRAHSPQAKGRIERLFGTLQDRLVKEMTLAGVKTITEANAFLQKYIPIFNERFGVPPAEEGSGHVAIKGFDLDAVFSVLDERRVNNDFTVRFENKWYQVDKENQSVTTLPRDVVVVEKRLDETVHMKLKRRDAYLRITALPEKPVKKKVASVIPATTRAPYVPSENHPWRGPQKISLKPSEILIPA